MNFNFFRGNFKPDNAELGILFDNLDLILKNQGIIVAKPEFYNILVCDVSYANRKITLGELLKLWQDSSSCWRINDRFYYSISGFSLSGNNRCAYFDRIKGYQCKYSRYFKEQKDSVFRLIQERTQQKTDLQLTQLVLILKTMTY